LKTLDVEEIRQRVASLEWYHTIDLGHGIVTPGHYDHQPYLQFYGLPEDLSGKTVLDVGAASGFFSFEMERRGAQVTATDLPAWMDHDFGPAYQPDKTSDEGHRYLYEPFELARSVLGSNVKRREITIYDLSPETVGTFDLVFCSSLLLHLTDPIRALWRIQSVAKKAAIIATVIHQNESCEPLALFAGHHRGDAWWLPNRACLEGMVQSAGFKGWEWVSEFRLDYRDGRPGPYHGVIRAWNTPELLV
jgi:tRNA (mo5U34)-methyltransferase